MLVLPSGVKLVEESSAGPVDDVVWVVAAVLVDEVAEGEGRG